MLETLWKNFIRRPNRSLLGLAAIILWPVSIVYRLVFKMQQARGVDSVKLSVPVISVGNITVGGTGKTPLVSLLGQFLGEDGLRIGIVSSGYGRSSNRSIMEQGYKIQKMSAAEVGDEVRLLALNLPQAFFSVDRSKSEAARRLDQSGEVDLIIVDDGFQHRELARDMDIVAYDAAVKLRHLKPFPLGILREPLSALGRADIVIITRSNFARDIGVLSQRLESFAPKAKQYRAQFLISELIGRSQRRPVKILEDQSVFLFAGIGNFPVLHKQVAALTADLEGVLELPDHVVYDEPLLQRIRRMADDLEADIIVTTAKDWVKIGDFDFGREIYYLDLEIDLDPGEEKMTAYLRQQLNLSRRQ